MLKMQGQYRVRAAVRPEKTPDTFQICIHYMDREQSHRHYTKPVRARPGEWTLIDEVLTLDWNDWISNAMFSIRRKHKTEPFFTDAAELKFVERGGKR
jgi:hypothetical protein